MDRLTLRLVGPEDTAFSQYIPGSFRHLLAEPETVCVGAVFEGLACGAALAQWERSGAYYLRYVYVDPKARLCGLGTYLLRGLLGQVKARGGREVKAVYSPSMLEGGRQTLGILERAGFSPPEPVSTGFSARLGDIPDVKGDPGAGMTVYSLKEAPAPLLEALGQLEMDLPGYACLDELDDPSPELTMVYAAGEEPAGVFLVERKKEGLHIAGTNILEPYRGGGGAGAMIARAIRAARALYPPDTLVWTSTLNAQSFAMCSKLLLRGEGGIKETELLSVCLL